MAANGILLAKRGGIEGWVKALRDCDPKRPVAIWPDVPDPAAIGYVFAWYPPPGIFAGLSSVRAIFSLGAGVDHLVFRDDLPDVAIVRVVNANMTRRMTEWVVLQVLLHHRQQRTYDEGQSARRWKEFPQTAPDEVRVGIMGMGVLGSDAAEVLARMGFDVAGWSRRPANVPGVRPFHGREQLDAFLARTDILVSLLPLTAETRGILAMPLFRKLARGGGLKAPVLINAGRGQVQVEADIVAALDEGVLGGVSLDVFEVEPLPEASALWDRSDVYLTPHCAAWSAPGPLAADMLQQIAAFERGEPLRDLVDKRAGY